MDQNISTSYGIKTQLSLASLMFFGPFIKHFLSENEGFELSESDKIFIKGYMVLGGINLGLGLLSTTIGILFKFFDYQVLNILFVVCTSILLFLLIGGSICVFANISIGSNKNSSLTENIISDVNGSTNAIRDYIPFINIYLWYSTHEFGDNHPIIKESMLVWAIFGILCLSGSIRIIGIFLLLIIMRIVTLSVIGNILPTALNTLIQHSFTKNIEEIWGSIIGWIGERIRIVFGHSVPPGSIQKEKQLSYSYLYDLRKYGNIQWQYLLLLMISAYLVYISASIDYFEFILLGMIVLWGRYTMMAFIWKHLPPVPVIHDLFRGVTMLFEKQIPTNKK